MADAAIARPFIGEKHFATLSNKGQVLNAMGNAAEAKTALLEAVKHPTAQAPQIHQLARRLEAMGQKKEAFEIYMVNHERNGDTWPVHVGMARAYIGSGDKVKALEHARKALTLSTKRISKRWCKRSRQAATSRIRTAKRRRG